MDALIIYRNANVTMFVNSTANTVSSNRTPSQHETYLDFEDYSILETLDYWPHQVILITLYSVIALVSFILNTVTIAVLVKCDKSISSELYIFLINLSVADLVMSLFCIPFTYTNFILNKWIFPHWLCPLVNCAQITSVCVSVLTLSLIGLDRYYAIIHPLGIANKCISIKFLENRFRKLLSIVFIWIFGLGAGSVQFLFTRVVPFPFGSQTLYDCRENMPENYAKFYTIFLFLFTFAIPLLILIYVYSCVGYRVYRHVAPGNPHQSRDHNNSLTREKVIKILILIVILFFLLWAPLNIFNLLVEFDSNFLKIHSSTEYQFFVYFFLISHFLAMFHSLVNSLVYCYLSRNFWRNFCYLTRRFLLRLTTCFQGNGEARERRVVIVRQPKQRTAHSIVNSLSLVKKQSMPLGPAADTRVIAPDPIGAVKPSNEKIELNVIHL